MKATINELWESGRQMISFDDSEFDYPSTLQDLRECDNVIVGGRFEGKKTWEVLIDNTIFEVMPMKVRHPSGGGSMLILEIV